MNHFYYFDTTTIDKSNWLNDLFGNTQRKKSGSDWIRTNDQEGQ